MLGVSSFVDLDYPHFDDPRAEAKLTRTFLGPRQDWTAPQVVDTGEVGKPVLLLTRDSFSNELLSFLYSHFSRIILAHNQDGAWRGDLIDRFKPDIVIHEVVESRLPDTDGEGPPPSAAMLARIDHALGVTPQSSILPNLMPASAKIAAIFAAASPTVSCNLETADLAPGAHGEAILSVNGWISELGPGITSPQGYIRLLGPGGDFAAPILVNGDRPDVAAHFRMPSAAQSGFLATYAVKGLPAGAYAPYVYRRSPAGWIVCAGPQTLTAP